MRRERVNSRSAVAPGADRAGGRRWRVALGLQGGDAAIDMHVSAERMKTVVALAPWLLAGHVVAMAALLAGAHAAGGGAFAVAAALVALLLALDTLFAVGLRMRSLAAARPSLRLFLAGTYALATGSIGAAIALLVPLPSAGPPLALHLLALCTAGAVTTLVLAPAPALALTFAFPILGAMAVLIDNRAGVALLLAMAVIVLTAMMASTDRAQAKLRIRFDMERNARKARHLLDEFEDTRRGWFWETDARGNLTYISAQLAEAFGCAASRLLGEPITRLVMTEEAGAGDNGEQGGERTLGFHLSTRLAFTEVAVRAATEGDARWWSLSGRPAFDDFGNFLGFRGSGTDLTEMRRSEAEINKLARYDALTGLPNRLLMRQTLDASLRDMADRPKPCGLFLLDLDRFKNVNDTLGHPVGDALLRQVAERLQGVIADAGRCGRVGGDEFKVVLPGIADRVQLSRIATAVIETLSAPYMIEGSHVSIGASIGVAIAPEDGVSTDSLVRNADLALYAAKAAGKGVARFYEHEMHANAKDRRQIELDLRQAIAEGQFHLAYQPVVHARTEKVAGFEALIRWTHPTRGPISPALFVPIAEEIGLIPQIGEWVLRTACREAAGWPAHVRIAVNLSPIQFASPALPGIVMSALGAAQLPADRLELEITEGVFLSDGDATDQMFARLKAIGVRFALDDFGTGYSSLGYLKKAPFNKIKIDQSFVRGAAIPGNRNAAIIKAIVALAESLGMETTAEGAETHDELDLIRSLGCSHVQGYIFGRPMFAADAAEQVGSDAIASGFHNSRSPRLALLRAARLHHADGQLAARLRNISATGAMVECDRTFDPGTTLRLELPDGTRLAGAVRWSREGRVGLMFDAAFDLDLLTMRTAAPRAAARG